MADSCGKQSWLSSTVNVVQKSERYMGECWQMYTEEAENQVWLQAERRAT